jgi:hypothetical protein
MARKTVKFGYFPEALYLNTGDISISTLDA